MDSLASSLQDLDLEDVLEISSSEDEELQPPFRFFDLPAELRRKILDYKYFLGKPIDIDFRARKLLSTFLVSKRFYAEATQSFYTTNTFRLLPTHPDAVRKRAQPLIKCFTRANRAFLTSMDIQLGIFWTDPPKCWSLDDSVGLEDAISLRVLKIFIQIDPGHPVFNGFRSPKLSYTTFCGDLLKETLARLPSIREVQIDGMPSVTFDLPLMPKLIQVALDCGKRVSFGPIKALLVGEKQAKLPSPTQTTSSPWWQETVAADRSVYA